MVPLVLTAKLFEVFPESCAHGYDAVCHTFHLLFPFSKQLGIVQNLRRNPGAMNGRVRVEWSDEYLDLRIYPLLLLGRVAA